MLRPLLKNRNSWKTMVGHRKTMRLPHYDYGMAGVFFVTICGYGKLMLFGNVMNEMFQIGEFGNIVCACWKSIPQHFPNISLDEYTIMPNHMHGILIINNQDSVRTGETVATMHTNPATTHTNFVGAQHAAPLLRKISQGSLSAVVRSFKSASTKRINEMRKTPGLPIWQRNYYEHVIRNEVELNRVREYIINNPAQWSFDRENPATVGGQTKQEDEISAILKKGAACCAPTKVNSNSC